MRGMRVLTVLVATLGQAAVTGAAEEEATWPYEDAPAIVKRLAELGEHESLRLPKVAITGAGMATDTYFATRGPRVRDYGNKMAYAPDRRTAMYAGANHGVPSRLNDCWEYHLGSNTWIRLAIGDGGDHGRVYRANSAVRKARNATDEKTRKKGEEATAFLKKWYGDHVVVKDGYLQTKINAGPVRPWHTWDALAYDAAAKRLLWAVLDTHKIHVAKAAQYAAYTGQDPEQVTARIKPGTGLYLFDGSQGRWSRQLGPEPRPYLRGMGGSLIYIPEWRKTIWYCAAQNVTPNDFAMWTYDGVANAWTRLRPNGGRSIRTLVHTDKVAPGSEVQMAYSPRHGKIVAVKGRDTFVYDLKTNAWSKAVTDTRNYAHDATTVFDYDGTADAFILINSPKGHYGTEREVRAFRLQTMKWETLPVEGPDINKRPYRGQAGYYDPAFNVFVVYDSGLQMWVYRVKKAKGGSQPPTAALANHP